MTVPAQRPRRSKQDYATPADFIAAVKRRLLITAFTHDFAADEANNKAGPGRYWGVEDDSLSFSGVDWSRVIHGDGPPGWNWGWLNPPFSDIAPWTVRCAETRAAGGNIALLIPAAVGSNYYRDYIDGHARVLALNGRIHFMPDKPDWGYPKDCILCLYSPYLAPGFEVWDWRRPMTLIEAIACYRAGCWDAVGDWMKVASRKDQSAYYAEIHGGK